MFSMTHSAVSDEIKALRVGSQKEVNVGTA
jgi:hypothetical protein